MSDAAPTLTPVISLFELAFESEVAKPDERRALRSGEDIDRWRSAWAGTGRPVPRMDDAHIAQVPLTQITDPAMIEPLVVEDLRWHVAFERTEAARDGRSPRWTCEDCVGNLDGGLCVSDSHATFRPGTGGWIGSLAPWRAVLDREAGPSTEIPVGGASLHAARSGALIEIRAAASERSVTFDEDVYAAELDASESTIRAFRDRLAGWVGPWLPSELAALDRTEIASTLAAFDGD